ncbi:hypothetical protein DFP72DRAFT_1121828 [Ephemerocybe angulata]|uniref:Uncharacterized protein n=1 Tax=Ephemerocybe angulata TaxID=980116 RepID=A0A8H6M5C8_9AGAR|nr:hypothetical protein DFP72DRAFT_1121828 [Tulosesus angulatus]
MSPSWQSHEKKTSMRLMGPARQQPEQSRTGKEGRGGGVPSRLPMMITRTLPLHSPINHIHRLPHHLPHHLPRTSLRLSQKLQPPHIPPHVRRTRRTRSLHNLDPHPVPPRDLEEDDPPTLPLHLRIPPHRHLTLTLTLTLTLSARRRAARRPIERAKPRRTRHLRRLHIHLFTLTPLLIALCLSYH